MAKVTKSDIEIRMSLVLLELLYRNHIVNHATYDSARKKAVVGDDEPKAA